MLEFRGGDLALVLDSLFFSSCVLWGVKNGLNTPLFFIFKNKMIDVIN
jgi:hypothetical protein